MKEKKRKIEKERKRKREKEKKRIREKEKKRKIEKEKKRKVQTEKIENKMRECFAPHPSSSLTLSHTYGRADRVHPSHSKN